MIVAAKECMSKLFAEQVLTILHQLLLAWTATEDYISRIQKPFYSHLDDIESLFVSFENDFTDPFFEQVRISRKKKIMKYVSCKLWLS